MQLALHQKKDAKILTMEKQNKEKTKPSEQSSLGLATKAARKTSKESAVSCGDKKCAIHSDVSLRGRVFIGKVISAKMQGTVTVEWPRLYAIPKFERFEKRRSRVKAHNPPCINAKEGDRVRIAECRPLAKTVKFVVIEKLSGDKE
nr:archaeal ribosomal protein S17P [uncultured archaeon]